VGGGNDYIQAELDKLGATSGVDSELEAMKREIANTAPKQLEANANGDGESASTAGAPAAQQPQVGDGL
jgi:phage shock protein A